MLTVLTDELVGTLDRLLDLAAGERVFDPDQPRDSKGRWTDVPGVAELIEALRDVAKRLNKGKKLDEDDPDERDIIEGIKSWTYSRDFKESVSRAVIAGANDDTPAAKFARAVAAAPPDAPALYRGMHHVSLAEVPAEGDTFDLGPTSLTRDAGTAKQFSTPTLAGGDMSADQVIVRMKIRKGSRALRVDQHSVYPQEREHVGMGRYRVVSRRESQETVKTAQGKRTLPLVEIEVEQVDPVGDPTFRRLHEAPTPYDYGVYN